MKLSYLTQKKGPLPIWAWSFITAIGLYLLYRMFKARSASSSANATPDTSATGATDPYAYGNGNGGGGGDPFAPIDGSGSTTPVTEGPSTQNPPPDSGNNSPSPPPTTVPPSQPPVTQPSGPGPVAALITAGVDPAIAVGIAHGGDPQASPITKTDITAKVLPTVTDLESKTGKKLITGPTAIKSVTNKTGVSANKGQGVISIH